MSYTVLARKYRPQTFADLVGQEHVSRTLGNAIESGRVAHAFLFTGARGVGKTTTARLLAKALNCEQGPTAHPCNVCAACLEIATGTNMDVLEIDGASNNGVDDVRRLQETLPFRPARDRFKIVIVDEVHMLSSGAFNAFLKTLEEPPAHVKFVFATTEIHKVPVTIRSRCQRYDFRLIPHAVVAARVRTILATEQIDADDAAVALVAREAAGSMRDALTVLDQLLALGPGTSTGAAASAGERQQLHGEAVASGLGIASRDHMLGMLEALLHNDAAACLRLVHELSEQGLDMLHFARQLLEGARDLVVLRVVGAAEALVELAPDEIARAQQLSQTQERPELERLFAGLTKLVEEVGQASLPQMTLEMGLVRLAGRPPLLAVQELVERLKGLEERLSGGDPSGGAAGSGGGGGSGERSGRSPVKRAPEASGSSAAGRTARAANHAATTATHGRAEADPGTGGDPNDPGPASLSSPIDTDSFSENVEPVRPAAISQAPAASFAPPPSAAGAVPPVAMSQPSAASASMPIDAAGARASQPSAASAASGADADRARVGQRSAAAESAPPRRDPPPRSAATTAASTPPPAATTARSTTPPPAASSADLPPRSAASPALSPGEDAWQQIVKQVKASQPALGAVLDHGMPIEISPSVLRLGFEENSFFGRQAQSTNARDTLLRVAEQVLGARPTLTIGAPPTHAKISSIAQIEEDGRRVRSAAKREAALSHPNVVTAMEIFGESEGSVDVTVELE
jgi:DNA polymerase-3 subunit gamma/tau